MGEVKQDILDQADVLERLRRIPTPTGDEHAALEALKKAMRHVEGNLREIARRLDEKETEVRKQDTSTQRKMWEP